MKPDRHDTLLDASLDEVLGGRTPPDLSARILQAWVARRPVDASVLSDLPLPGPAIAGLASGSPGFAAEFDPLPPPIVAPRAMPTNGRPLVELPHRQPARRKTSAGAWQSAVVAASLVGLLIGGAAYLATREAEVAETRPPIAPPAQGVAQDDPETIVSPSELPNRSAEPQLAKVAEPNSKNTVSPSDLAANPIPAAAPAELPLASPPVYRDPAPDPEVISFVNASLAQAWTENGVTPSPPATDSEWCRRLYVRVLGRIPTVEELKAFTTSRAADSRTKDNRSQLVERLLTDEMYVEEYARHWASVWSNVLVGRTGGRGDSPVSREGFEHYLRQSLANNKPYDKLVQELLTATGSAQPGTEAYSGAVNFLLAGMNQDATLATARVSRVFLGHQLQCAQCHNHPTQEWSQQQFWALNSFFRQLRVERSEDAAKLVNVSFSGQGKGSTDGEVFYETPTGLLKTAFPVFLDGTAIPPGGDLAEVDRRAELAKLVTQSDQLPRALVNRMWAHFFGYGFTRPVDDMGSATAASHPELLDRLADEFVARDFDLKSVIRWIALSDAFGRSSKMVSLRTKDMPEAGELALFSRYYSRQLPAEEVYNSLVQAAQIRKTAVNEAEVEKARVDWLAQFNRPMGTDDADEESHFSGGIGQSLIMMNGDLMRRAASSQHDGLLKSVSQSKLKFEEKVSHLFLAALSREPASREQQAAREVLKNSAGNEIAALEDIWWALLNSNEFILDH